MCGRVATVRRNCLGGGRESFGRLAACSRKSGGTPGCAVAMLQLSDELRVYLVDSLTKRIKGQPNKLKMAFVCHRRVCYLLTV
jgi:hypothetical protein